MVSQHACILLLKLLAASSLLQDLKHFYFISQDKCYQYWPTEGSVTHGEITIEIKSDTLSEAISIRDFLVTFNQVLLPETFSLLWTEHPAAVVWALSLCQNFLSLRLFQIPTFVSVVSMGSWQPCYQVADLP